MPAEIAQPPRAAFFMPSDRAIRFLDPAKGEHPCALSRWRHLIDGLCVCDVCDEPPVTCYAKQQDYAQPLDAIPNPAAGRNPPDT